MRAALPTLLILLVASPARAGSLDEFRDSIDRDRSSDSRSDRGGESSSYDDSYDYNYECDDDDDGDGEPSYAARAVASVLEAIFRGDSPRHRYSWGETPYDGRRLVGPRSYASTDSDVRLTAPSRPGHFMGRLDGLGLLDGSALGFGIFGKVESTYTPGFVVHHQQVMDFGASDRLGITKFLLEPRIITEQHFTMFWNFGGAVYGSEDGLLNGGVHVGFGFTITPYQPLLFEARFGVQALADQAVLSDFSAQIGIESSPGVFIVAGYRGLGGMGAPLHMGTAGVQVDLGFGGPRERWTGWASLDAPPKS